MSTYKNNSYIVVIPARYASTRYRGKPLIKILNREMILRVADICLNVVGKNNLYIATDNKKIEKIVKNENYKVVMTSLKCLTGTDRVAEVAKKIRCDFYINVQGDEPFFYPNDLKKLIKEALKNPKQIINGYSEIKDKKLFYNSSIPKVVFDNQKYLLYMSRGPIPSSKEMRLKKGWRQICAYSFPREALKNFNKQKVKTKLEAIEDIEILRFIENNISVKMIEVGDNKLSIDTKSDLKIARKLKKN